MFSLRPLSARNKIYLSFRFFKVSFGFMPHRIDVMLAVGFLHLKHLDIASPSCDERIFSNVLKIKLIRFFLHWVFLIPCSCLPYTERINIFFICEVAGIGSWCCSDR